MPFLIAAGILILCVILSALFCCVRVSGAAERGRNDEDQIRFLQQYQEKRKN